MNKAREIVLRLVSEGKISVEEAFYYASYILRSDQNLDDYSKMMPQINDQYPRRGIIRSNKEMYLGD